MLKYASVKSLIFVIMVQFFIDFIQACITNNSHTQQIIKTDLYLLY